MEKDWFKTHSPAEIIAMVTVITLAKLSTWTHEYLQYLGWFDNDIVDKLYTLTNAGVWIARVTTTGATLNYDATTKGAIDYLTEAAAQATFPTINDLSVAVGVGGKAHRKIGTAGRTIVSNAGGTLDADMPLVAAHASAYFGVAELLSIRASQNVAAGATFVIQNGAGVALTTITLPALVANTPLDLRGLRIFPVLLTDSSLIYIDTTSHDLGNATTFTLEYDYWYET